jgi:hypothetical protein
VAEEKILQCVGSAVKDCDKLQYSSSTKRFGHNMTGADTSKFKRALQVREMNDLENPDDGEIEEVVIEVTIQWENQAGNTTDLVLTDSLTAWGD